jgi:outer membrane scaffolding protein for murein synthesis (MipA/OmpV family)
VSTSLAGMSAKVGSVDGSMTVFTLGTDYMFTRNWGMGASYMYAKLDADVTKSGFNGNLNWSNNSLMLYATMKF